MLVKLKDVATFINGRAYLMPELQNEGKYRIVRVGNFSGKDEWYYSDMELDKDKYCEKGDLLYKWACNFGPEIWNEERVIFHYHIWKLLVNERIVNKKYLYYTLLHMTPYWLSSTHGSTMIHITKGTIEEKKIEIPDLNTQNKVANVLTSIDAQIERNNEMVKKLQVLAQSTFHYFFSNCSLKKELLSTFIVENKKSVLQVNEVEDTRGMIPFFTSGDTIKYVDENLVDGFNLFLSTGGNASVKSYYGKASYSTDTWCITAKNGMQFYVFEYIKMIENQMDSLYFHGTGLKHLQKPLFLNSEIPVPTNNLAKYNSIVEPIFRKISYINEATIKLNNLKDTLLPLLINQQLQ